MSNILLDAYYSLSRNLNKLAGKTSTETEQGVVSEKFPELTLDLDNASLLKLTQKWEKSWLDSDVYAQWQKHGDENENYWLGKHFQRPEVDKSRAIVDNVIFEAIETYLPQIIQRNPEPMVSLDEKIGNNIDTEATPEQQQFATNLQKELGEIADELRLRLKLKKAARHWAIYLVGAVKLGWDMNRDMPTVKVVRGRKLILDANSTVDEDGYTGDFIGEYRKMQASIMIKTLAAIDAEPDAEKTIKDLVEDDTGTELQFIEWWTDEYMCWTIGNHVLLKKKNPHWNYDKEVPAQADATTGEPPVDEEGKPQTQTEEGMNHFNVPKKPYLLLSVFNLGKQPVDDTSLIGQNLSNQDVINKRVKQIDKNADSMNGGMVVSLERAGMTIQQAAGVTEALRKGGTVAIPAGAVGEAIARISAPPLPRDVYEQLIDTRARVSYIFGTKGFQPSSGGGGQGAVRMAILNKNLDEARIGGGFSEYLEQFADDIYNWFVQLLYVYDDDYSVKRDKPEVHVSVKEGSLLPKDAATIAAQSIQLANGNKMALVDLYKRLDYPNPEELAANVWLELNAPEILYKDDPRVQQAIQAKASAAGGGKPPSESINFKDLPPEGKVQLAAKAGLDLHPEAVAAHEAHAATLGKERSNPTPVVPQPQEVAGQQ